MGAKFFLVSLLCLCVGVAGFVLGRSPAWCVENKGMRVGANSGAAIERGGPVGPASAGVANAAAGSFTNKTLAFDWRQVESPDYRVYIGNLRTIGCPEETVIDIVCADVQKLYDERARALERDLGEFPYWRADTQEWQHEFEARNQALRQEQRAVVKALLGISLPEMLAEPAPASGDVRLSFLDAATESRVNEIEKSYRERLTHLLAAPEKAKGDDPLGELRAEREAELDAVLQPDQREEVELRVSPLAEQIRAELNGAEVTPEQFRTLFRLHREFQRDFPPDPFAFLESPERTHRRNEAERLLAKESRRIIGAAGAD